MRNGHRATCFAEHREPVTIAVTRSSKIRKHLPMSALFRLSGATRRDPTIEEWL